MPKTRHGWVTTTTAKPSDSRIGNLAVKQMWPISDTNQNVITLHEQAGYAIDVVFVVVVIMAIIYWRWRKNVKRIKELEARRTRSNA